MCLYAPGNVHGICMFICVVPCVDSFFVYICVCLGQQGSLHSKKILNIYNIYKRVSILSNWDAYGKILLFACICIYFSQCIAVLKS